MIKGKRFMKTRQGTRKETMTKIKLELPERKETPPNSSSRSGSDNENSSDGAGRKQFGIVTNSLTKKRNLRNPVVSFDLDFNYRVGSTRVEFLRIRS